MRTGIYIKLDSDILEFFKSDGPGYQARINAALRSTIKPTPTTVEPKTFRALAYAQVAFSKFFAQAFWHHRPDAIITERMLPEVLKGLRCYGGKEGFREAEQICRLMNSSS